MFQSSMPKCMLMNVVNFVLLICLARSSSTDKYFVDGDLILGALMPVHDYNETSGECEGILAVPYIKRVEALVYAVDKINKDLKMLPGIKLGFDIRDTCYYDAVALGESVNFVLDQEHVNEPETCDGSCIAPPPTDCTQFRNISGVVGAQRSSSSIQAATTLGLFNVPQISYLSTSDELSDKIKYEYFLRTVPPDRFQVTAMIDLVLHFNWTYVSILYSDDSYGRNGYSEFQKQSADQICLAVEEAVSVDSDMKQIVQILLDRGAVAVVLFLDLETANAVFDAVERLDATGVFIWIASDAIGNAGVKGIAEHEAAAEGSFTMVPYSERLRAFDLSFISTNPSTSNNPWFSEYYERNCSMTSCIDEDDTDSHDTLVMDSVYAFAYALHSIQSSLCHDTKPTTGKCVEIMRQVPGDILLEELRRTSFDSLVNGRIEFDSHGDIQGRYKMSYFQRDAVVGRLRAYPVGTWTTTDGFSDFNDDITWSVRSSINGSIPQSQCSETCPAGFKTVLIYERVRCCWECKACTDDTIVDPNNHRECWQCNGSTGPDNSHMECLILEEVYVSWGSHLGSLILITASIGLVGILIVLTFFIFYRKEQILQTSEPLLNYLILFGETIVLVSTITFAVKPTDTVCAAARLLPAIGGCLMYSSMALKSIRLQKIFSVAFATDSTENPKLIQRPKQLGILLIVVSIQVIISSVWLLLYPPDVLPRKVLGDSPRIELACNIQINEVITSLAYNFVFILVCCASVFKARRLPDNYYESRFLSFCSFTTVVILLAFLPPYFVTDERELFTKCIYISSALILNCWVVLICIFVIKIYAIRYVKPLVDDTAPMDTRLRSPTATSTRTLVNSMYLQRQRRSLSTASGESST